MLHKPYKSLDEQIAILRSRGMIVHDSAVHALRREGYYSIVNGYKNLFLDANLKHTNEDHYLPGTTFDDLFALFSFDRQLRGLLFEGITQAEASLKAACAHEFTKLHPDEVNPYLIPDNYSQSRRSSAMTLINKVFTKILELDGNPHNKGEYGGKTYIRHCMEDLDGQVPFWVLANDLSLGQTVWFFQTQTKEVRLAIAESFTALYADTHAKPRVITIKQLDRIFNRLVFFRNLCAHDERCYCAHYDNRLNESVFQTVCDLAYLMDKESYGTFFQKFFSLIDGITETIPRQAQSIITAIGIHDRSQHLI
ncbi:Abi family protein [Bifidobacterium callitrichidarum]|uniref:DNA-binding protein n=1 Tax=Bifidobacterium callitrichidarum TaxID=2052941 RepID=A0A2U2NAZ1_9BIFI|nr:Abi family protein [Bifidobacterium callitrichidarum]PWG66204.1 DNA-binding protein [Bifidobacterium callitrichidarum]